MVAEEVALGPRGVAQMLKDIIEVRAVGRHRLDLRFEDGVEGEVDLSKIVALEGVFSPLQEPKEVAKVKVDPEIGTVCWPNGADLDPDVLYSIVTGNCIKVQAGMI